MGLTIAYSITAPANWLPANIRAKLEAARQYAKTLPVVSVSELAEFRGKDADYEYIREAGLKDQDRLFAAKAEGQRVILNPWQPGTHARQAPSHMLVFAVDPANGSDEMYVGICSYREHLWKAHRGSGDVPAWSVVFDKKENAYPDARKVLRAFMRRWRLRRMPESRKSIEERCGQAMGTPYYAHNRWAWAGIYEGRYVSHSRGRAGPIAVVQFRDRMTVEIAFRFMGKPQEAEKVFASKEFRADLNRMVCGEDYVTPPASGIWSSSCQTQYANDPRCGGWDNFVKAHLGVLAVLEHVQNLGFKVKVRDEGGFWEKRDFGELAKVLGNYDALVASAMGVMKDAAEGQGTSAESPVFGRPDFEHLEAKGHETMGDLLKRLFSEKKRPRKPSG